MPNAPAGAPRLQRPRPDPTTPATPSRLHQRSIRFARDLRAGLGAETRVRGIRSPSLRRRPAIAIERALPLFIAALLTGASLVSVMPGGPTGGSDGPGDAPRIAVGGGLTEAAPQADPFIPTDRFAELDVAGDVAGGEPLVRPAARIKVPSGTPNEPATSQPAQQAHDFRPLVLPGPVALDMVEDPEPLAGLAEPVTVQGPFLDDGTLVAGFAPDTSVTDGRALLRTYEVKRGDTLAKIAKKFEISAKTLFWANKLKTVDALKVGQTLVVPPVNGRVVTVGELDTMASLAEKHGVTVEAIVAMNGLEYETLIVGQTLILPGAKLDALPTPTPKPRTAPTRVSTGGLTYSGGSWAWPVVGGGNYISQYFRYGHYALDIAADYGSTVRAATGGKVVFAGWKSNGGGYQVHIAHGGGLYTTYNHMSRVAVGSGQLVGKGQAVGRVGCTGYCSGPHLHFEVWVGGGPWEGTRVNPLRYY